MATYIALISAIVALILNIIALAKIISSPVLRKQAETKSKFEKIFEGLDEDDERIRKLESNQDKMLADNEQLLRATEKLLSHAETGNNTGELREQHKELMAYLTKR